MLALGIGVYLMKFCVTAERRDAGMRLPGKGAPESGSRTAAAPVFGSFLVDDRPVRSPDSCAGVGTRADSVLLRRLQAIEIRPIAAESLSELLPKHLSGVL